MKPFFSIFSANEVNTKRQNELDLLKSVTIFVMIFGHITEVLFSRQWEDLEFCDITLPWQIFYIVANSIVAFSFMFSMGCSIPFSRNQNSRFWMLRGIKLIFAWFMLHLLYVYPLASIFAAEYKMGLWEFAVYIFCSSDILFFAGVFFLFIGILRKFNAGLRGMFLASVILFAVSNFIKYTPSSMLMGTIMGNFISTEEAAFPFFNWIIAPMTGMCWGTMLRHCTNKNKLYSITGTLGVIGTAILLVILYIKGYTSGEEFARLTDVQIFYNANIATLAISCTLLAIVLSFYYFVTQLIQAQWFTKTYHYLAKELTNIYCIQWVIIPWAAFFLPRPTEKTNMWWSVLTAVIIMGICTALTALYSEFKNRKRSAE